MESDPVSGVCGFSPFVAQEPQTLESRPALHLLLLGKMRR